MIAGKIYFTSISFSALSGRIRRSTISFFFRPNQSRFFLRETTSKTAYRVCVSFLLKTAFSGKLSHKYCNSSPYDLRTYSITAHACSLRNTLVSQQLSMNLSNTQLYSALTLPTNLPCASAMRCNTYSLPNSRSVRQEKSSPFLTNSF